MPSPENDDQERPDAPAPIAKRWVTPGAALAAAVLILVVLWAAQNKRAPGVEPIDAGCRPLAWRDAGTDPAELDGWVIPAPGHMFFLSLDDAVCDRHLTRIRDLRLDADKLDALAGRHVHVVGTARERDGEIVFDPTRVDPR